MAEDIVITKETVDIPIQCDDEDFYKYQRQGSTRRSQKGTTSKLPWKKSSQRKKEIQQLHNEVVNLDEQLRVSYERHREILEKITQLADSHPMTVHGKTVNYQCKNTIVTSSNDGESPIERLEVLLQKLTVGLDENTKARAEAEYKQRESEILLNEIMSSLKECKHLVAEHGSKSTRSFSKVCSLLEKVALDRSDLSVFKEGIHTLRQCIQRRMVRRWDDLPRATQITVDRIVAKLDITEWLQFARILKVSPASLKIDPESFDDDMKTRVFVEWVEQSHEHNEVVLLSLVEGKVEEKCAEVTRGYKEQCFSKPLTSTMSANSHTPTQTAAGDLGPGHNREVPPDNRTMIEHLKILMELELDTNSKVELVLKHQEAMQLMLTKT